MDGCGLPVHAVHIRYGYQVYTCSTRRHVAVRAETVDEFVIETLAARLSRPDALAHFAAPSDRGDVTRLRQRETALRARGEGLAEAYAAGDRL